MELHLGTNLAKAELHKSPGSCDVAGRELDIGEQRTFLRPLLEIFHIIGRDLGL